MTIAHLNKELRIEPLTYDLAVRYAALLTQLANQIPEVTYTEENILAEKKGDREMLCKWLHSLVVLHNGVPIAFIMGYERAGEGSEQYTKNTLYVSELAVEESYQGQGIAKAVLTAFFMRNNKLGLQHLEGELNYSIQTNSADWNAHVVKLYESFGFKIRAKKEYSNRTDVILGAEVSDLIIS